MRQFNFSDKSLKKRIRLLILMLLFVCLPYLFLFTLLTTNVPTGQLIETSAVVTVLVLIIFAVEMPLLRRSMRAMKLSIESDKIVKQYRKGEQCLSWIDIVGVKFMKNPRGDYINIRIYGKGKKTIHLGDFEQMHEIADLIRENISDDAAVETKQNKIDYESPTFFISVGLITMTIMSLIQLGGQYAQDVFCVLFSTAAALFLLIYRPMSKFNPRMKLFETIIGWLLILSAIYMLI